LLGVVEADRSLVKTTEWINVEGERADRGLPRAVRSTAKLGQLTNDCRNVFTQTGDRRVQHQWTFGQKPLTVVPDARRKQNSERRSETC
jgi:hypothetical protein